MKVLLFGITREITGQTRLIIPADKQPATVRQLKEWMAEQYPAIKSLSSLAIAVDSEYADDDVVLNSDNEIALIPPVSGG